MTRPAHLSWPISLAKATVEISKAPNIAPSATATPAAAMIAAGTWRPRPPVSPSPCTGGSVSRCARSKAIPPTMPIAANTSPDAGCTVYARAVTTAGPATKRTSSKAPSSENAVWMSSSLSRMCDHLARVSEPSGPESDAIATPSHSKGSGPRVMAVAIKMMVPITNSAVSGIIIRCPLRSTHRAVGSVCRAHTMTPTATTRPAISQRSYWIWIISIAEMLNVEIGSRASSPASANWSAPGF